MWGGLAVTWTSKLSAPSQHEFSLGWSSLVSDSSGVDGITSQSRAVYASQKQGWRVHAVPVVLAGQAKGLSKRVGRVGGLSVAGFHLSLAV